MEIPQITTERLRLRGFTREDMDRFNELVFADPEARRYLPVDGPLSPDRLDASLERGRTHWDTRGYGVWAVCALDTGEFMGHCGLQFVDEADETELLYAVGKAYWGRGLVTEAAAATLRYGFDQTSLPRIVAYAVPAHRASRRIMEKLGMAEEDEVHLFGLDLVRYGIGRAAWAKSPSTSGQPSS